MIKGFNHQMFAGLFVWMFIFATSAACKIELTVTHIQDKTPKSPEKNTLTKCSLTCLSEEFSSAFDNTSPLSAVKC